MTLTNSSSSNDRVFEVETDLFFAISITLSFSLIDSPAVTVIVPFVDSLSSISALMLPEVTTSTFSPSILPVMV